MKFFKLLSITLFSICALVFTSCNNDDSSGDGTARISVKLVDEPGDYDHVYVEVIDVLVRYDDDFEADDNDDFSDDLDDGSDDDFQGGDFDDDELDGEGDQWISLNAINTGIVDLLDLTGGVDLLLVDDQEIPSGNITDIRLILGENNTVVIDGNEFDLKTPSGQQSGLKIKVDAVLEANFGYTFILDFNVDESIVDAGNSGNIILKPVMRATIEAFTGAISGQVDPAGIATKVSATTNGVDYIATNVDINGNFVIAGTPPGIYTVLITPDLESLLEPIEITDVEVTIAQTTDIGTVDIDPDN